MKCAFCNHEINKKEIKANAINCLVADLKAFTVEEMGEEWQARAEKAESELKAIKARIKAVTDDEILEIIEEQDEKYMNCLTADEYIAKAVIEIIKQIGGGK